MKYLFGEDFKNTFKILDHGYVKYIAHLGSDESIVEAARMSTGRGFVSWDPYWRCEKCSCVVTEPLEGVRFCPQGCGEGSMKFFARGDNGLLETLYVNGHMTPFEMGDLVVEMKAPIEVFRQLHRHRTFSINEMSARYSQMPNEHYVPAEERFAPKKTGNKQADSAVIPANQFAVAPLAWRNTVESQQEEIYSEYETMLQHGVPKETARINTPVSRYSVMRWKANLRNWLQMFTLRDDAHAQWECREAVKPCVEIVRALFSRTIALWEEHTKYAVKFSRTEMDELRELLNSGGGASDAVMKKLKKSES